MTNTSCANVSGDDMTDDTSETSQRGILDGIRVLDFTRIMAGPWAAMLLADFGADVIKVETPEGETSRTWGEARFGDKRDISALFVSTNRNKRGVSLNLRDDRSKKIVQDLVRRADVVIHSFRN